MRLALSIALCALVLLAAWPWPAAAQTGDVGTRRGRPGAGPAWQTPPGGAGPDARRSGAPREGRLPSLRQATRFMDRVARRENRFYQPGVGYDGRTGLTFDGVNIDFKTGRPVTVRNWSAPSKESLHIALLVKALEGDRTAQLMLAPDPRRPGQARARALEVLERKIATYERFDRQHPGFGGFLPWYRVADGRLEPIPSTPGGEGWESRVPALDNGQLAWSIYYAANALADLGHADLARRYQRHLDRMARNVVDIFYDPKLHKMRAEARVLRGSRRRPSENRYALNERNPYCLEDSYEGLLLCHFADLFGDWRGQRAGKEAIWQTPRRQPAAFTTASGEKITIVKAWVGSSHEEWGEQILPFNVVPLDRELFANAQRARTAYSAERGIPGLFASTHRPIRRTASPEYASLLGFRAPGATLDRSRSSRIVTPYAAFPLALTPGGKPVFAAWLKTMLDGPRMFGPYGMGESCSTDGRRIAPCLTWDGKALPMLAWMGGIRDEVRGYLARDKLLDPFAARVRADFRLFDGMLIQGTGQPIKGPTATIPTAMSDFGKP